MYLPFPGSTFPLRGLPPTGGGHSLPSSLPPPSPTCLPLSYLSFILLLVFLGLCLSLLLQTLPSHIIPPSPTCLPLSYLMSSLLLLLFLISYLCMSSPAHFPLFLLVFLIATHLLQLTFPTSKLIFCPSLYAFPSSSTQYVHLSLFKLLELIYVRLS